MIRIRVTITTQKDTFLQIQWEYSMTTTTTAEHGLLTDALFRFDWPLQLLIERCLSLPAFLNARRFESADFPEVWHGTAALPVNAKDIKFRYFVCMILDIPPTCPTTTSQFFGGGGPKGGMFTSASPTPASHPGRYVVVRRWETNIRPRSIRQLKNNGGYFLQMHKNCLIKSKSFVKI